MWKRFTKQGNYKWTRILKDILSEYNNTVHSTIKMKPIDVTVGDEPSLIRPENKTLSKRPKYKVGDQVRISKVKKIFDKGYLQNWTNEVFTVRRVSKTNPVTYLLSDFTGEDVSGSFYEQELQRTRVPDLFLVEKVLRKQKYKDGKTRYLVKWKGYDVKHSSWVDNLTGLSA
jgi:hypothetical protein